MSITISIVPPVRDFAQKCVLTMALVFVTLGSVPNISSIGGVEVPGFGQEAEAACPAYMMEGCAIVGLGVIGMSLLRLAYVALTQGWILANPVVLPWAVVIGLLVSACVLYCGVIAAED